MVRLAARFYIASDSHLARELSICDTSLAVDGWRPLLWRQRVFLASGRRVRKPKTSIQELVPLCILNYMVIQRVRTIVLTRKFNASDEPSRPTIVIRQSSLKPFNASLNVVCLNSDSVGISLMKLRFIEPQPFPVYIRVSRHTDAVITAKKTDGLNAIV